MKTFTPVLLGAAIAGLLGATSANAWTTVSPKAFSAAIPSYTMAFRVKSFGDPAFGGQAWAMHGDWGTLTATKGTPVTITVDASAVTGLHPAVTVWKRPVGTVAQPYSYYNGPKNVYQKDASGNFVKDASGNKIPANLVQVTNLAPATTVPDHNFTPTQSYIETGASQQHIQGVSFAMGPGSCTDGSGVTCVSETKDVGTNAGITAKNVEFWTAAKRGTNPTAASPVLLENGATEIGFPRMLHVRSAWDADGAATIWNQLNRDPLLVQQKDGNVGKVSVTFTPNESVQYEFFVGGLNPDAAIASSVVKQNATVTVTGVQ